MNSEGDAEELVQGDVSYFGVSGEDSEDDIEDSCTMTIGEVYTGISNL
jgi:hypothetical protein